MYPEIQIAHYKIPSYLLLTLLGGLFGGLFAVYRTKKAGLDVKHALFIILSGAVGMDIGSRLLYALTLAPGMILRGEPFDINRLLGGMVFYGGLFGSLLAAFFYIKKAALSFAAYADVFAPAMALCHAIGRIGCFLAGCCHGADMETPFVIGSITITQIPVQMMESLFLFILCIVLTRLKPKRKGGIMQTYLIIYALLRFILEFLRGDDLRGHIAFFSVSQWISIGVVLIWLVKSMAGARVLPKPE